MSQSGTPGSQLTCHFNAAAVQLLIVGTSYLADFTGHFTVLLDPNELSQFQKGAVTNGVTRMTLLLQEFVTMGVGNLVGPIIIYMDRNRVPPRSTLMAITPGKPFPAVQDMVVNIHVTIPNLLPGITLQNKLESPSKPAILRNDKVTHFPPNNDVYNLVEPIELEDVNKPGPVLATILNFPTTVSPPTS